MDARLERLKDILGKSDIQFRVPNFQRSYSWKKDQYERLYEDFLEAYLENKDVFLGSLVVKECISTNGISRLDVIDGQQRFTTIAILFAALRDLSKKNSKFLGNNLEQYLMNTTREGEDRFKIVAKKNDHMILTGLISGEPIELQKILTNFHESNQFHAYKYFKKELEKLEVDKYDSFRDRVLERIRFVYITLKNEEDEYVIFECLNARGTPLTQPELINNLILMNIDEHRRDEIYNNYCQHWEKDAEEIKEFLERKKGKGTFSTATVLTNFFFSFFKSYDEIKEGRVYSVFREKYCDPNLSQEDKIEILEEIKRALSYYKKIITISYPKDSENEIERILYRIVKLEVTVCYPFLIILFDNYYHKKKIAKSELIEILKSIENYLVRNSLTGKKTNGLNKVFISLAKTARNNPNEINQHKIVNTPPYPDDVQISHYITDFNAYKVLKSTLISIFQAIEDHYSSKMRRNEWVHLDEKYQIEHICPLKLDENQDYDITRENHNKLVNTLGNLTLNKIGDENSKSKQDRTLEEKKAIYRNSSLVINKFSETYYARSWNAETIRERTNDIIQIILKIYPDLAGERKKQTYRAPTPPVYGVSVGNKKFKIKKWAEGFYACMNYAIDEFGMENAIILNDNLRHLFTEKDNGKGRYRYLDKVSKYLNVCLKVDDIKRYTQILSEIINQPIEWIVEE